MTIRLDANGAILLEGACPSEDAEMLLRHLLENPAAEVDWRTCEGIHAAVVQVLLAAKPALIGPPISSRLEKWVQPLLTPSPTT